MGFSFINCSVCRNRYLKDNRHINENIKLKQNFYCSSKCQSKFKNKRREFRCENKNCKDKFLRTPGHLSKHNFCSKSCAAIFNNAKRYGMRKPKIILTTAELAAIRLMGSRLGGKNRWLHHKSVYTKKYIVDT